ncbi:hypothetical protein N7486_000112 [Penicillium sp. IBT 16267x]|nr:hypothetical protein N7486_000112 [Penicillium sp. IBT 16267x]
MQQKRTYLSRSTLFIITRRSFSTTRESWRTVPVGKDAKNISEENARDHALGYTAGNDVSARNFQLPEVSGGQFCDAKSFDKFAPTIVSTQEIPDPQALQMRTKVNGGVKHETSTGDMP